MKTISLLFSMMVLLLSCGEAAPKRSIVVLDDVTPGDTTRGELDLLSTLELDAHQYEYTSFTYTRITDTDFNEEFTFELDEVNFLFTNDEERQVDIDRFTASIDSIETHMGDEIDHSAIWIPMWNRILKESKKKGVQSTIYLVSDCIENDFVNLHDVAQQKQLRTNPEAIVDKFRAHVPKGFKTTSIKLIICHTPEGKEANHLNRLIINTIYRPIMQDVGIDITTQSNL